MSRIVSLGAALQNIYLIDHNDFTPPPVVINQKVTVDKISYQVGGGGVNTALMFAEYGHETILISSIAEDIAGGAILSALNREDIDSSYLYLDPKKPTGTSIILLDSNSSTNVTLTHHGAAKTTAGYTATDLDLIHPDWIYATTAYGDMDILRDFFEQAHLGGTKVMFNPGPDELGQPKKLIGLLEDVDILYVNKTEAAKLVPGAILTELLSHLNNYVETAIITDGAMGGIASNREEAYRFGIYEDVKKKDATGAGDAFGAGFLAHYADGHNFKDSLIFASANATSVVGQIGGNSSFISKKKALHPMPIQKI